MNLRNKKLPNPLRPSPEANLAFSGRSEASYPSTQPPNWHFQCPAFTMIELLIVLSILGIAATLVTASYLGYEKRQRVKSAALDLKNQIRFAQNRALSGDKGFGTNPAEICPPTSTLVGWYVNIDKINNDDSYFISGDCLTGVSEAVFAQKIIQLPKGVTITSIDYNGVFSIGINNVNILFRPLENDAKFFDAGNPSLTPPFLDPASVPPKLDPSKLIDGTLDQGSVTVTVNGFGTTYVVEVLPTGGVSERKI